MSAGATSTAGPAVHRDLGELAPLFREAVERSLEECQRQGLDAYVYEAYRTQELQAEYYARGRTKKPPNKPVTNASTNLRSWHGYGLAVDVISRSKHWNAGTPWFRKVAAIFKANGCKWGGDWRSVDLPHMQWGRCRASPSDEARRLLKAGGFEAVWQAVGAAGISTPVPDRPRIAQVTASSLRLRPTPSMKGDPIASLPRGTEVEILEISGEWLTVRVNVSTVGFVHGDYVG